VRAGATEARCHVGQFLSSIGGILDSVSDPSSRLLKLLLPLQAPREWPGSELAERLQVSRRTIRRDVERLLVGRARVRFGYPAGDGTGSTRLADPHHPVAAGRLWYLLA
jgi:predicted DNA-binding transcriptional regulator YafY